MIPYRRIWCVDFEFRAGAGQQPAPLCMVASEFHTGETIRLWREGLRALSRAPFPTDKSAVFCAYYASAEIGCFLELGWPVPQLILDLYCEHRCQTNGLPTPFGDSLIGALRHRGLHSMSGERKETMRQLILQRSEWSAEEQTDILSYCTDDTIALRKLFSIMSPAIDWPRALLRGRYMAAIARMERTGVPIDAPLYRQLANNWKALKGLLISEIDQQYGVYEGTTFKAARFADWLQRAGIPWPRLDSGALALDNDTFRDASLTYPQIAPLKELRSTLSGMRLTGLEVGPDGRNRCMLSAFGTKTGRNAPSNTKFAFGPAVWLRSLIKPPEGRGIVYCDFSGQEIAIAAALSADEQLIEAYQSGDPYIAFARAAGLVPADATAKTHPEVRRLCKTTCLGVNYGMAGRSLAYRLNVSLAKADELLRLHKRTYTRFWRWADGVVAAAMLGKPLYTCFGWIIRAGLGQTDRSLQNWPIQSAGSEMLRIACIALTEAGIRTCAPVHHALLVEAELTSLDDTVALCRELMRKAGVAITRGVEVRVDASIIRYPDRYSDPRGVAMWTRVVDLMGALNRPNG
jgi:DNA polymerase-1